MKLIKRKDYDSKGRNVCAERRLVGDGKKKRYYCIHEECIFEESEDLEWWKEVGGKNLLPEGVSG